MIGNRAFKNPSFSARGATMPPHATAVRQEFKSGRILPLSEDAYMREQLLPIHAPGHGGKMPFQVDIVFRHVEKILKQSILDTSPTANGNHADVDDVNLTSDELSIVTDELSHTIARVACEIVSKGLDGVDPHMTTISIFNLLRGYSWEAKLVLTLAAFALNYGEFWLLVQIFKENKLTGLSLAKQIIILKQLAVHALLRNREEVNPWLDKLGNLIEVILKVTSCLVDFIELQPHNASELSVVNDYIPIAIYWNIRSILLCATQITKFTTMQYQSIVSTEAWESTMVIKLNELYELLEEKYRVCKLQIEEKEIANTYEEIVNLFETVHIDNVNVLKALISDNENALCYYSSNTQVTLKVERLVNKNLLLLISDVKITPEEIVKLENVHKHFKRMTDQYEIIWIPIVDQQRADNNDENLRREFEIQRDSMKSWYTVSSYSLIRKGVIRFIKERWNFNGERMMLVLLNQQGKVTNADAYHMIRIWGRDAFPFTRQREEELWGRETWKAELLVHRNEDDRIKQLIEKESYIFFYGGRDVKWVKDFTEAAILAASDSKFELQMVYLGKNVKKNKVQQVINNNGNKQKPYGKEVLVTSFWAKLESMKYSMFQTANNVDQKMKELRKLLSYDKAVGWAVLSKGNDIIVNGYGTTMLMTLQAFNSLAKDKKSAEAFESCFFKDYELSHADYRTCCRLDFPAGYYIPDGTKCPECNHPMTKMITLSCCHNEY